MSVLMPDRALGVKKRGTHTTDSHGDPAGGSWGPMVGPWPGRAHENPNGAWAIAVDTAAWPVNAGDLVVQPDTATLWLVTTATLMTNNVDNSVDYVRIDALERSGINTVPTADPTPTTRAS